MFSSGAPKDFKIGAKYASLCASNSFLFCEISLSEQAILIDFLTFFSKVFSSGTGKGLNDFDCITDTSLPEIPVPAKLTKNEMSEV